VCVFYFALCVFKAFSHSLILSIEVESTLTDHGLGNVFEAMMEKRQDQIPDEGS
jgi:hypothetical protein